MSLSVNGHSIDNNIITPFLNISPPAFPSGFILQKDFYLTNLLYANDQFSTKSLSKKIPFRPPSGFLPRNPTQCLKILRQNGNISNNTENEKIFYSWNTYKPKKLGNLRLKFPLPVVKVPPLSNMDYYSKIRDPNIIIRYLADDLNVTSNKGKKIFYTIKDSNYINNLFFDNDENNGNSSKINDGCLASFYKSKASGIGDQINLKKLSFSLNKNKKYKNNNISLRQCLSRMKKKNKYIENINSNNNKNSNNVSKSNTNYKTIYPKDNMFRTQIDFNKLHNDNINNNNGSNNNFNANKSFNNFNQTQNNNNYCYKNQSYPISPSNLNSNLYNSISITSQNKK